MIVRFMDYKFDDGLKLTSVKQKPENLLWTIVCWPLTKTYKCATQRKMNRTTNAGYKINFNIREILIPIHSSAIKKAA